MKRDLALKGKKNITLGGSKASMSASEALGNLSLIVRFSFFLSAPDSLCWAFASTAFLNIFLLIQYNITMK